MGHARRLNLGAIETSLRGVQAHFADINKTLSTPRDPLSDFVLERLLLGYRRVDALLDAGLDPFAPGSSAQILDLNLLVLCGADRRQREECAQLVEATNQRFYALGDGGFESLVNWVRSMNGASIWRRAASAYSMMLERPKLLKRFADLLKQESEKEHVLG
jgi:hypothetical protein